MFYFDTIQKAVLEIIPEAYKNLEEQSIYKY